MSKEERFEIFNEDGEWVIKDNEQWVIKDNEQSHYSLDLYQSCVRLNEFVDRIANLEAKFAESEKQRQHLRDWLDDVILTSVDRESHNATIDEYEEQIAELEQQLAEQGKRSRNAIDDLRNELNKTSEELEIANNQILFDNTEFEKLKKQLAEKEEELERLNLEFETQEDWQEKWQKLYDETCDLNQDKISFCIEWLENVKKWCEDTKTEDEFGYLIIYVDEDIKAEFNLLSFIDNQIKQLKEMK